MQTKPAVAQTLPDGVGIRWLIRRDMAEVLEIEQKSFPQPWTEDEFVNCLKQRNCIGMIIERHNLVRGFMIYELQKSVLHLLNFAVHPLERRSQYGRWMIEKLIGKLHQQRRRWITAEVSERNLPAQLFLQAMGFRATNSIRGYYEPGHDAIQFRFELPAEV